MSSAVEQRNYFRRRSAPICDSSEPRRTGRWTETAHRYIRFRRKTNDGSTEASAKKSMDRRAVRTTRQTNETKAALLPQSRSIPVLREDSDAIIEACDDFLRHVFCLIILDNTRIAVYLSPIQKDIQRIFSAFSASQTILWLFRNYIWL